MAFFFPPFLSLDPLYSSSVPVVEPATVGVLFFVFVESFLNKEKDGMVKSWSSRSSWFKLSNILTLV